MRILKALNEDGEACRWVGQYLPSLDFAGLSALVGTSTTNAGIPYTCLVRGQMWYLNAYVTAGTLGLAQAVLSCMDWRPARILIGAGEVGSMRELCGAKASGNASYVGLQSATTLPVRGVVGEAVVLELLRRGKTHVSNTADHTSIGRDAGRPTYILWAEIEKPDNIGGEVCVAGEIGALINTLATLVCIIVLVLDVQCHEWLGVAVVATGMFLNAAMAFLLRLQRFELPTANIVEDSPAGDAVVLLKDDPDVFIVLWGTEKAMQILLQKEVILNARSKDRLPLFLVSLALMLYSALVVLGVPHMGVTAQFLFLIAVCFGAMTDLIKGSWNGKRGIAKEAIEKYGIKRINVEKFGNRTTAVACVAAYTTKVNALKAAGICPTAGAVWQNWWTALETLGGADDKNKIRRTLEAVSVTNLSENEKKLWTRLKSDMVDGLEYAVSSPERQNDHSGDDPNL